MKNSSLEDMIWTGCNCRPGTGTDMLLHALLLSQKNCLIGRRAVIRRLHYDDSDMEGQLKEVQRYTVEELFCRGYARYFWEAVKIRYPEYCFYVDLEDMYAED